jgi:glycosyltransferase involved in cell wall biosynthesis
MELIGVEPAERRRALLDLTTELGLSDHVTIDGVLPREKFLDRVAAGELAVSCSQLEAFGLPVAEALVMGAPLIASDIPSHRELIARAGAGETVKAGDVVALARRLAQALAGNVPKRLKAVPLGWSWRERAREHVDAYEAAPLKGGFKSDTAERVR